MTTMGPNRYVRCPNCSQTLYMWRLASGNTFGSTLWSDGYLEAPMLMAEIVATKCPSCNQSFFVEDAQELGHFGGLMWGSSSEPVPAEYEGAPRLVWANLETLNDLLGSCRNPERIRFLLVTLWHEYNHHARTKERDSAASVVPNSPKGGDSNAAIDEIYLLLAGTKPVPPPSPPEAKRPKQVVDPNALTLVLERLVTVLGNDSGQDQIMKAEALRQLGRHDQTLALLRNVDSSMSWVATQIVARAKAADTKVFELEQKGI